jgi:uncharacterized protein (TIGR03435 family)
MPLFCRVAFVGLLIGWLQSPTPRPTDLVFEVASIKEVRDRAPSPGRVSPDRFVRRNTTLADLLVFAYQLTPLQVENIPTSVATKRFNVDAKAPFEPTADEMRAMVRALLAERFHVKAHLTTEQRPRYVLTMARADARLGAQLRPSEIDCTLPAEQRRFDDPLTSTSPQCSVQTSATADGATLFFDGAPIQRLAQILQQQVGRVVIDETRLSGRYQVELFIPRVSPSPDPRLARQPSAQAGVSLFTVIQEQLGLKLIPDSGPVDVLIVDQATEPSPD